MMRNALGTAIIVIIIEKGGVEIPVTNTSGGTITDIESYQTKEARGEEMTMKGAEAQVHIAHSNAMVPRKRSGNVETANMSVDVLAVSVTNEEMVDQR